MRVFPSLQLGPGSAVDGKVSEPSNYLGFPRSRVGEKGKSASRETTVLNYPASPEQISSSSGDLVHSREHQEKLAEDLCEFAVVLLGVTGQVFAITSEYAWFKSCKNCITYMSNSNTLSEATFDDRTGLCLP